MHRSPPNASVLVPAAGPVRWVVALTATVLVLVTGGCTMCPSPFDYSGPVPNGSAPQNDFRARSNGILPIGGQPKPWPPVVEAAPPSTQEPTLALPPSVVVAATDDATWLVVAAAETAADIPTISAESEDSAPANDQPSDEESVAAAAAAGVVETPLDPLPALEPPPRPTAPTPVLRETEGWRPKR